MTEEEFGGKLSVVCIVCNQRDILSGNQKILYMKHNRKNKRDDENVDNTIPTFAEYAARDTANVVSHITCPQCNINMCMVLDNNGRAFFNCENGHTYAAKELSKKMGAKFDEMILLDLNTPN